jgi:hypothetical protein
MRLIIELSADRRYKNLLTSNKVTAIILDEYTDASRRDLILIVYKAGRERL